MLPVLVHITVFLYALTIVFVLFHSLFDAHLIFHYLRAAGSERDAVYSDDFVPFVTIQLPVYNERHVVERLLDAVAAIDYPADKLEIQVLDDSTDETSELIAQKVAFLRTQNIKIRHLRRQSREGFKAGALKYGLAQARGSFLAVFDADFLPASDFLKRTIPFFADPSVGMVQTKWGHLNKETSLLARLQALALDGHFSIEQKGRNAAGYFMNFNGTAGVWRLQAILDAGNWQADTLTEDLDLSYRAQMKGWKFKYLEHVCTPAELPPVISAVKSQQFRWAKGGAETARKNLKALLFSPFPLPVKLHGAFHLIYSFGFFSIILLAVLTVPLLFLKEAYPHVDWLFRLSGVATISFFIYVFHYCISFCINAGDGLSQKIVRFMLLFPLFVSLVIGISLSNAVGIVQGYLGVNTDFVRTPKFNAVASGNGILRSSYAESKVGWITFAEGVLMLYFLLGLTIAVGKKDYGSIPLLLMALAGFAMVFWWTIQEKRKKALVALHD